jgi:oligoribonuclease
MMAGQAKKAHGFYVWFDTEDSTTDLEKAALLQGAVMVTDSSLRRVLPRERDVKLAVRTSGDASLSPWVEQNLPDLVKACRSEAAVDVDEADERIAAYVDIAIGKPAEREDQRPVLAGNSVHFDWWLARRFLPRFVGRLHYRHLDVSAFKHEWQRLHPKKKFDKEDPNTIATYFPEAFLVESGTRHDAYYDIQASVAELGFYRRYLFTE